MAAGLLSFQLFTQFVYKLLSICDSNSQLLSLIILYIFTCLSSCINSLEKEFSFKWSKQQKQLGPCAQKYHIWPKGRIWGCKIQNITVTMRETPKCICVTSSKVFFVSFKRNVSTSLELVNPTHSQKLSLQTQKMHTHPQTALKPFVQVWQKHSCTQNFSCLSGCSFQNITHKKETFRYTCTKKRRVHLLYSGGLVVVCRDFLLGSFICTSALLLCLSNTISLCELCTR